MANIKKLFSVMITFFCLVVLAANLFSQQYNQNVELKHNFSGEYTLVERSDWSQYVNGKYIGLTSREARGYLNPIPDAKAEESGATRYSGDFYVFQQTKKNNVNTAHGLDEIQPASFVVNNDNSVKFDQLCFYPQLRNFPVFPKEQVKKGSRWQSLAERVVDPLNDGQYTILEIPVEYEFVGEETYKGKQVYRIRAKFATRINQYNPPRIRDSRLKQATGTHDVNIIVDAQTCAVVMILDRMDETFAYNDGGTVRYRGNVSLFTEIPVKVEDQDIYERAVYIATGKETGSSSGTNTSDSGSSGSSYSGISTHEDSHGSGEPGSNESSHGGSSANGNGSDTEISGRNDTFNVEKTDKGVRLSVRNLQFYADSAKLLPGEEARLDAVAEVLRSVPNGMFLIEGHTAAVGRPEGEKQLSVERAKAIVDALVIRGFRAEQFMYYGYGGTRPIADNNTDAGRAANRRVEITILQ